MPRLLKRLTRRVSRRRTDRSLFEGLKEKQPPFDDFKWVRDWLEHFGDIEGDVNETKWISAVRKVQRMLKVFVPDLKIDGLFGPLTMAAAMNVHRCAEEPPRESARARGFWGKNPVRIHRSQDVRHVERRRQDEILRDITQRIAAVCGLTFELVTARGDITIGVSLDRSLGFGRPGFTLGSAQIPPSANWTSPPLLLDLDAAEPWDDTLYFRVLFHELLHSLGFRHVSSDSIMEPILWAFEGLTPLDKRNLADTYGQAARQQPPDEPVAEPRKKTYIVTADDEEVTRWVS